MQMLYCFINNIHVDYVDLLWEGLHYSLEHPSILIPYLRFTKLIVSHYMTAFFEISRRARDKCHNLEDDMMVKNIFNLGKHKDRVGMKISSWMITDEMKLIENYQMYDAVFGKSCDELEAKQNVQKVKEHLIVEEIEKLTRFIRRKKFNVLAQDLQEIMEESLPKMVDDRVKELTKTQVPQERENLWAKISSQINNAITNHIPSQDDLPIWLALKYKFERLHVSDTLCRPSAVRPRDQDNPHDDAHPEGENDAKAEDV
nr:hypothetical protein [Tanacetum cinerariifolium]